jgi:type III secretion protein V
MAGIACLSLAAIPNFPHIQFLVAGGLLLALAVTLMRNAVLATNSQRALMPEMTRDGGNYVPRILDDVELGTSSPLRVRLGVKACDALHAAELNRRFSQMRRDLMVRLGVPFPGVGLLRDATLEENRYIVDLDDVALYGGTLVAGHVLVSGDAALVTMEGIEGYHPQAEKSVWVPEQAAASIDAARIVKSSPDAALCDHLMDVCEQHASSFIGTQETRFLLDQLNIEFRELVNQIQQVVTTVQLAGVLRSLLEQHLPIRNLRGIVEAILRVPDGARTLDRMVRDARIALGHQLVRPLADLNSWLVNAAVLDPAWEADLEAQIEIGSDGEPQCVLDAERLGGLQRVFAAQPDAARVVVTTALLRPHLARILRMLGIRSEVLAMEEIPLDIYRVQVIATLEPD